jgi:hypothetical protein
MLFPTWKNPGQGRRSGVIAHEINLHHDHNCDNTRALALAHIRKTYLSELALKREHQKSKSKLGFKRWKAQRALRLDRYQLEKEMASVSRLADHKALMRPKGQGWLP